MTKTQKRKSVTNIRNVLHILYKSLAFAPYSRELCNGEYVYKSSTKLYLIYIICLTMAMFGSLILYIGLIMYSQTDLTRTQILDIFEATVFVLISIIMIFWNWVHRDLLQYVYLSVPSVDNMLQKLGINYKQFYYNIFDVLCKWHAMNFPMFITGRIIFVAFLSKHSISFHIAESLSKSLAVTVRFAATWLFIGTAYVFCEKLRLLNKALVNGGCDAFPDENIQGPLTQKAIEEATETLKIVAELHALLCKMMVDINKVYSIMVFLGISLTAFEILSSIYLIMQGTTSTEANEHYFWTVFGVVNIFFTLIPAELATSEAKRTPTLLAYFQPCYFHEGLAFQRNTILLQMQHINLNLNVCGLYELNFMVLIQHFSMISGITMFMVEEQTGIKRPGT